MRRPKRLFLMPYSSCVWKIIEHNSGELDWSARYKLLLHLHLYLCGMDSEGKDGRKFCRTEVSIEQYCIMYITHNATADVSLYWRWISVKTDYLISAVVTALIVSTTMTVIQASTCANNFQPHTYNYSSPSAPSPTRVQGGGYPGSQLASLHIEIRHKFKNSTINDHIVHSSRPDEMTSRFSVSAAATLL